MRLVTVLSAFPLLAMLAAASVPSRAASLPVADPPVWSAVVAPVPPAPPPKGNALDAVRGWLTADDPVAFLEAMRYALDEVADGDTYVWHRKDGPLWGKVKPTASFLDDKGAVCRHVQLMLALADVRRDVDAVACRSASRQWVVSG